MKHLLLALVWFLVGLLGSRALLGCSDDATSDPSSGTGGVSSSGTGGVSSSGTGGVSSSGTGGVSSSGTGGVSSSGTGGVSSSGTGGSSSLSTGGSTAGTNAGSSSAGAAGCSSAFCVRQDCLNRSNELIATCMNDKCEPPHQTCLTACATSSGDFYCYQRCNDARTACLAAAETVASCPGLTC